MRNVTTPLSLLFDKINEALKSKNYSLALRLASNIRPEPQKLTIIANIKFAQKDYSGAELVCSRILTLEPENLTAKLIHAKCLFFQKRHQDAESEIESLLINSPGNEEIALLSISNSVELDKFEDAEIITDRFIGEKSKLSFKFYQAASQIKRGLLKPHEALAVLEQAEQYYPDETESILKFTAEALSELDPTLAAEAYEKLRKLGEQKKTTLWNNSFAELRRQNWKLGWELYEHGLSDEVGKAGRSIMNFVKTIPLIESLDNIDKNKYLVLVSEQGIGDQVIFLSCLNEVLSEFPKVILIAEDRLIDLYSRSFKDTQVIGYALGSVLYGQLSRFNGLHPIGSLMKRYRLSNEHFSNTRFPYIVPDERHVKHIAEKIRNVAKDKKIIGLSWSGGFWQRQKLAKSKTFEQMAKLLSKDHQYVCLQYGDCSKEKAYSKANGLPLLFIDGFDFTKDIEMWVALIAACDEVLSVSTAAVHFAGAMQKNVRLVLSEFQSPFIWGTKEGASLIYPSVHIFRQQKTETEEKFNQRVLAYEFI